MLKIDDKQLERQITEISNELVSKNPRTISQHGSRQI